MMSGTGKTLRWASPQQLSTGGKFGRKTDMFSMGLVFIYMLFKAEGVKRMVKVLQADDGFGRLPGNLKEGMDRVLTTAMNILEKNEYPKYGLPLFRSMLAHEEKDRFSVNEAIGPLQDLASALLPDMVFHCSSELEEVEEESELSEMGVDVDYNEIWRRKG
jgi:serine/threonine protein kinase